MKKIVIILLTVVIMTSFVACEKNPDFKTDEMAQIVQEQLSDLNDIMENYTDASDLLDNINPDVPESDLNDGVEESDNVENVESSEDENKQEETFKPTETVKPEHKHTYNSKVTKEATCGANGIKTFTCSCGNSYAEKIDMTGKHAWCEWETIKKSDTKNEGLSERKCSVCSATESKVIEKTVSKRFADVVKPEILDDPNYTYPYSFTNVVTNERFYTMHPEYFPIYDYYCFEALLGYLKNSESGERVITFAQFSYKDQYDDSPIDMQIKNDIEKVIPLISDNATLSYCLCNEEHRDITDTIDEFWAGFPEYLQNTDGRVVIEVTIIDPDAEFKAEYGISVYKDKTFVSDVIIRRTNV